VTPLCAHSVSPRQEAREPTIRADQPEHVVQQIVGHKHQGVTMGVYFGGDTMERLRECMEAVRLPAAHAHP